MLRRLTITTLATTLIGVAAAQQPTASPASALSGVSVTCTASVPSWGLGCFAEKPVLVLGPVEFAVGVDAYAALTGTVDDASLAPYGVVAVYMSDWSAWAEVRMPELYGVPVVGTTDWLRVGFTYRIE